MSAHASREALCAVVASGVDVVSVGDVSGVSAVSGVDEVSGVSGVSGVDGVTGVDGAADEDYALARVLAQAATDPSITRVDQFADIAHLSVRALQRLTRRYIGVSPKWLIMRARVHDALEALHAAAADPSSAEPLDDLAARLGWFDQSHFTRDFRSIVGQSPAAYRDQLGLPPTARTTDPPTP
nr:helix-turn-helix domain-containing protein [Arsenicicoccus piscis]